MDGDPNPLPASSTAAAAATFATVTPGEETLQPAQAPPAISAENVPQALRATKRDTPRAKAMSWNDAADFLLLQCIDKTEPWVKRSKRWGAVKELMEPQLGRTLADRACKDRWESLKEIHRQLVLNEQEPERGRSGDVDPPESEAIILLRRVCDRALAWQHKSKRQKNRFLEEKAKAMAVREAAKLNMSARKEAAARALNQENDPTSSTATSSPRTHLACRPDSPITDDDPASSNHAPVFQPPTPDRTATSTTTLVETLSNVTAEPQTIATSDTARLLQVVLESQNKFMATMMQQVLAVKRPAEEPLEDDIDSLKKKIRELNERLAKAEALAHKQQ